MLRAGARVALVGAPNTGKSSLLNALAGADVAIVAELPGTTRDRVERVIEIEGIAFDVVDTAGLRPTADPIERLGIERALAAAAEADILVEVLDDHASGNGDRTAGAHPTVDGVRLAPGAARLLVRNKIDLTGSAAGVHEGAVHLSARTGAGLDALRSELLRMAGWEAMGAAEGVFLARERHLHALERAARHLADAREHGAFSGPRLELMAEDLRLAAQALGEITGEVSSDELLGRVFSRFCIGK